MGMASRRLGWDRRWRRDLKFRSWTASRGWGHLGFFGIKYLLFFIIFLGQVGLVFQVFFPKWIPNSTRVGEKFENWLPIPSQAQSGAAKAARACSGSSCFSQPYMKHHKKVHKIRLWTHTLNTISKCCCCPTSVTYIIHSAFSSLRRYLYIVISTVNKSELPITPQPLSSQMSNANFRHNYTSVKNSTLIQNEHVNEKKSTYMQPIKGKKGEGGKQKKEASNWSISYVNIPNYQLL